MTNNLKIKSFDFAVDFIKQIFFLASGAIILSITLFKELARESIYLTFTLYLSWLCFIACIWFGINALRWIIGHAGGESIDLFHNKITRNAKFCRYAFLAGIITLAAFAFLSISFLSPKKVLTKNFNEEQIIIEIKGYDYLNINPHKGQIHIYSRNANKINLNIKPGNSKICLKKKD